MLYVSTRSTGDFYTAYRALNEAHTPDGGYFVPHRLPVFTESELAKTREQPAGAVIATILNLFFGMRLTGRDIEYAIGRMPIKPITLAHNLCLGEAWRNPGNSMDYTIAALHRTLTGKSQVLPAGWSCIAIKISLLFGLYASNSALRRGFDVAVAYDNLSDITAVLYARDMGLPVNMIICTCNGKQPIWDLLNKGACSVATATTDSVSIDDNPAYPMYWEQFLYNAIGRTAVTTFRDTYSRKTQFVIEPEQHLKLREHLYIAVASPERVANTISNVSQLNLYPLNQDMALAYSGLQDYRAGNGMNKVTVMLAKNRPNLLKE